MAYVKNNWVDQEVQRPKTYEMVNNSDGSVTLIDSFGLVTELGTPVNADNMNHIEEGLTRVAIAEYSAEEVYEIGEWVKKDDKLYKVSNDIANPETWEEIKFGGDSNYRPPLLSSIWSDHLINDIQWLRADTFSWQDGNVYSAVYDKLVEEYNTGVEETEGSITFKRTPNGFKITNTTQEQAILNKYNTDGIAWYYILDVENKRFKLPRTKFGFEGLRTSVGDDIAESLPNNGAPVQERATQMYLYFYVGNFTQTALEQTAGITAEMFNAKLELNASNINAQGKSYISGFGMPSDRYIDLTLGASGTEYTAPANGWFFHRGYSRNVYLCNETSNIISELQTTTGNHISNYIPVKRGDKIILIYFEGNTVIFRFIYAEGEE